MAASDHLRGKSIIDLLWQDLDSTMDLLMEECEDCGKTTGVHVAGSGIVAECDQLLTNTVLEYSVDEYRGRAQGVAYALSLMSNPYLADVAAVRKLAKERYEDRLAGREMQPLQTQP